MLAEFFPDELPEDLEKVTVAAFDNFGVVIEQGEALSTVRDKIRDALKHYKKSQVMEFI